jgi:hypothetical protein
MANKRYCMSILRLKSVQDMPMILLKSEILEQKGNPNVRNFDWGDFGPLGPMKSLKQLYSRQRHFSKLRFLSQ